ncbi:MAG: hypothetical protein L6R40_002404 [Gallowayella cf. fulva]|nr:MAG: hypothetical protein L6R40_002404 [Xanthomendoza cf. fulva]
MFARRSIVVFACLVLLSALGLTLHRIEKGKPGYLGDLVNSKIGNGIKGKGKQQAKEGVETGGHESHGEPCGKNIEWLANVDLRYPLQFAQRDIFVHPTPDIQRKSLTRISGPLFPQLKTVLVDQNAHLTDCPPPVALEIPDTPITPVNASRMHFGIATTLQRLEDSTPYIAQWLRHTEAKLFVVVIEPEKDLDPTSKEMAVRQAELRKQGLDVTLLPPLKKGELYTETYFSLAKVMYTHRTEEAEWFVLMDDDTFFPSMRALLAMLDKYDPGREYWIGAVSEMWWSVARYGMMAFGGAGIFLSRALAAVIDEVYDVCTTEMHPAAGGDERVMRCVYGHTETKLTNEPDLHQMDIFGDLSGVYESGRLPLSLHHWKGDDGYPVDLMSLVMNICGDCFLQRWQFGEDTVLSNGFSIAVYPEGGLANGLDFSKAEETWESHTVDESVNPGTAHSMSPARPRLALDKQKIQYRLLESAYVDGAVRQSYIHKGKEGTDEMDTLLVLYWRREDRTVLDNSTQHA